MGFEEGKDLTRIDLWKGKIWLLKFWVYQEILEDVLCKNPHLKTYYNSFPIEQCSLQYVKVLSLNRCGELEHLDLREFPNLRFLAISDCPQFNLVTGWEVARSLGSIEIRLCISYGSFPNLQYLSFLKEFAINRWGLKESLIPQQLSQFSQCAKLRRLEIWDDKNLSKIADLTNLKYLKFLEFLDLGACTFSNIQGLSGLQALKTLHLKFCKSLRRVPDLGCLKGLTELNMSYSGVEDVIGVGELHMLTFLNLNGCESLKWLPFLGHLKALIYLDLRFTGVKEILGREDLMSLKTLCWNIK